MCGLSFKRITNSHLNKRHGISSFEFSKTYPNADRGLIPWSKGKTKQTHPSLLKLSQRLASQKRWNFSNWQKINRAKLEKERKKKLKKNNYLAEFIGVLLGDGNLTAYPRTDAVRIVYNSEECNYINHIAMLIEKIFNKKPTVNKRNKEKATDIVFYKSNLSKKLDIPCGNKIKNKVKIPEWIKRNKVYFVSCLKGLFETDGCFCEDKSNYTCVIEFKNNCRSLLQDAYQMLKRLGHHPQFGKNYVRLARKKEVFEFKNLLTFRNY